jgi:hypothetical protein
MWTEREVGRWIPIHRPTSLLSVLYYRTSIYLLSKLPPISDTGTVMHTSVTLNYTKYYLVFYDYNL